MDLASFKLRYPSFTNDIEIEQALSDASLFVSMYEIDKDKLDLATALMTAHLLTIPDGATEQKVKKVKADTVEVEFSDKVVAIPTWLESTSYGTLFLLLIRPNKTKYVYGVINDSDRLAIKFDGTLTDELTAKPSEDYYDKPISN